MWLALPWCCFGAFCGITIMAFRKGGGGLDRAADKNPHCNVSIVLFTRAPGDVESETIDNVTGVAGYSHSGLDACELDDDGDPLYIECKPGHGVVHTKQSHYGDRPVTRVHLPPVEAIETYGCARGRIGLTWQTLGTMLPSSDPNDGLVCATLIYQCLPQSLRDQIDAVEGYSGPDGLISPNQIAVAFGARPELRDVYADVG